MAAAPRLDEGTFGAVRQRGVRERVRAPKGGAFGHEDKVARRERDREAGRLDDGERGELLFLWSGFDAALGVRSVQGAVEDRLMRSPPRVGPDLERQVELTLLRCGRTGAAREKLVEVLVHENVGATRHEARMALRRMVGAGRIEYFVVQETRKKTCSCKVGAVDNTRRQRGECRCGAGEVETVPREMARLVVEKSRCIPHALDPGERWRRADEELEAYCRQIACCESSRAPGSRLPPDVPSGRADAARRALRALEPEHRRTIERAYGAALHQWSALSLEASRLSHLCPAVERVRKDLVDQQVRLRMKNWNPGSSLDPSTRRSLDRGVTSQDALRQKLDRAPEGEGARVRWRYEREAFIAAVEREAGAMLLRAVERYREARGA